ncbi:SOS response-associated peptidase family protein [Billgrantia desiderata]|uniref:SOS response-associated peptidase family protein n=1 Tax=Billgrantia desiderata TaxID=52021 RepID=UPI001F3A9CA0
MATSGYFKHALARSRCIVPADGWFEWLAAETGKLPHYLTRSDREPLAFAGIYAEREDGSLGCAILTEPARGELITRWIRCPSSS